MPECNPKLRADLLSSLSCEPTYKRARQETSADASRVGPASYNIFYNNRHEAAKLKW